MTQKRYLHIGFYFAGIPLIKELEPIFASLSEDWIRYAGNCWIVWTANSPEEWLRAFQPKLGIKDKMLILELSSGQEPNGYLPEWIWHWLFKNRIEDEVKHMDVSYTTKNNA